MKKTVCWALASSLLLSGCGSGGFPGLRPTTYSTAGEARIIVSDQACPHHEDNHEIAALLAPLAVALASTAITKFGNALSDASKGGPLPSSVGNLNFEEAKGTVPQCVFILRGEFAEDGARGKFDVIDQIVEKDPKASDLKTSYQNAHLPGVNRLDHFIELAVLSAKSKKAYTMAPVFLWLNQSVDGDTSGTRDLSVLVKFQPVGEAKDSGGTVLIPNVKIGSKRTFHPLHASSRYLNEMPWFAGFNVAPVDVPVSTPSPNNNTLDSPGLVPISISSTVVETRPEKAGLAFIAAAFGAAEPGINTALKPYLDPAAALTAQTDALTTNSAANTSMGDARLAILAYCKNSSQTIDGPGQTDRLTKAIAAETKRVAANVAALKAGNAQPYTIPLVISDGLPLTVNAGFCSTYAG